ncbi:BTB/POZ domain-containing protein [Candidatus Rhabdochlamydia sp. T3358]|uniref:BTB/POZ domain-containing protein n=1 Tax=Candidatus Rhabdochlamydia sp. T3358 TaxID=2099795 RepID=UPI0010B45752|nr:BTB/POZ domain-containing protein [Candidatus Rhabdochlamydia sp. T3358]VHO05224.1 BTB/POZ domain protein [Candidatus Rhabdochlamydia sp. T3358]
MIDKIDATALILQNEKDSKYENLLSFNSYLEKSLLIFISNDHSKELEVVQWVKNRINTDNITYYLSMFSLGPNIILSIACTAYLEKNKPLPKNCQEHLIKSPRNALFILNAGCLAKDDLVIKTVWEIIFLNKNFEIFKADEKITSLDYLLNKKEFSNQTLIVGDSQNPQEILVNREILSQRNLYFHALFQTNFLEGSLIAIILKDQDHTKKLQNIDYEGFLYLLRYIYTGDVDVPLDLCLTVSHLADLYLEPNLKKICDKKKWDQAVLSLKHKNLIGKFQSSHYEEFFYLVHEIYTGKTDISSVITLKDLNIETLQNTDYQAVLYLLHYIYTGDENVPSNLCSDVSRLADDYSEPDLKKACDQKTCR